MLKNVLFAICGLATLAAVNVFATSINFNFYVDDYATVSIDGNLVGSYDNSAAAGNIVFTDDLTPGWHTFDVDYANQSGTNFLALQQEYPGDSGYSIIPLDDFESLNASGDVIGGLRADYYDSLGGAYDFTVYGEGPIDNGALSFSSEIYESEPGLWAGVFGPSSIFEEKLSGEIDIVAAPEPSSGLMIALPAIAFLLRRSRRSS
jgi:hypothetical protein